MAPQSKKRKELPQSTTLHKFFSPNAMTEKKRKTVLFAKGTPQVMAPPSEQVIVIHSDSDGHIAIPKKKGKGRKKLESSQEYQPEAPGEKIKNIITEGAGSSSATATGYTNNNVTGKSAMSTSTLDGEKILSFGEPSSLLRSSTDSVKPDVAQTSSFSRQSSDVLAWASPPLAASWFGAPVSLLRGPLKSHDDISTASPSILDQLPFETVDDAGPSRPSMHPIQSFSTLTDSNAEDHDDDLWAMGDDEMALVTPKPHDIDEENVEEIEVDSSLLEQQDGESVTNCPICTVHLVGLFVTEVQDHVNKCIDSLPPQPHVQPTMPSISKPLIPVSAIQTQYGRNNKSLTDIAKTPPKSNGDSSNAFSVLMSSHKEYEARKEVTIVEDRNSRPNKGDGGRRKAPFYKVLQGMPIAVDAFRYGRIPGVTAYFLTHAHSDHYTNLASNWKNGPIYCSHGTANLIIHMLSINPKWVHPLPVDVSSVIPNTGGVRVTLIEANHCPGSCLFFFEGPQTINAGDSTFKSSYIGLPRTFRYLHCGDFRASPKHVLHPAVKGKRIDHIYLDTTYLDPKYTFPPQPLVVSACAELAKRIVSGQSTTDTTGGKTRAMDSFLDVQNKSEKKEDGKILIVVGTYSIGKERIVKAIAQALDTKIYCDARKAAILRCQSDPELHTLLTTDPLSAGVHLVPLSIITSDRLKTYMDRFKKSYSRAIGFRPTGWTYTSPAGSDQSQSISSILSCAASRPPFTYSSLHPSRNSTPTLTLYGVPYSEHSSFFELTCFAMSLEWGKMIATVNVDSANSRGKMAKWFEKWEVAKKKRGSAEVVKYQEEDYW